MEAGAWEHTPRPLLCAKRSCLRGDSEAAAADEEQLSSLTELHFDEPGGAPLPFHISITDGSDNRVAEDARVCD
jgi:hypothetical protein